MATTVPRTTLAILLVLFGVFGIIAGSLVSMPLCAAGGSTCPAWNPLGALPALLQGSVLIGAGLVINSRY